MKRDDRGCENVLGRIKQNRDLVEAYVNEEIDSVTGLFVAMYREMQK